MISVRLCFATRFHWIERNFKFIPNAFNLIVSVVKILKLTDKNFGHQDSKTGSFTLSFTLSLSPTEHPKLRGSKIRLRPPGSLLLSPKGFPLLWHALAPPCRVPPPPVVVVGDPSLSKKKGVWNFEILKLKLNIEVTFSFNWLVHNEPGCVF